MDELLALPLERGVLLRTLGTLLLVTACGQEQVPEVCGDMCVSATLLYGACVQDWGASFEDAGYSSAQGFLESCDTWAWQRALFEEEALSEGALNAAGWLADTCEQGLSLFDAPDAVCSDYFGFDWLAVPSTSEAL